MLVHLSALFNNRLLRKLTDVHLGRDGRDGIWNQISSKDEG